MYMWPNNTTSASFARWFALCCTVMLVSGCATAELTLRTVDEPAESYYRYILVSVTLADNADTVYVTNRFISELEQRDLQTILPKQALGASTYHQPGTALLKVEEVERRIETMEHRRWYGRTSLTQMRGRKLSDVPVITLRATLIDTGSKLTVFQADYVTQGPWYADSATVMAALAGTLVKDFEREGFIAGKI